MNHEKHIYYLEKLSWENKKKAKKTYTCRGFEKKSDAYSLFNHNFWSKSQKFVRLINGVGSHRLQVNSNNLW